MDLRKLEQLLSQTETVEEMLKKQRMVESMFDRTHRDGSLLSISEMFARAPTAERLSEAAVSVSAAAKAFESFGGLLARTDALDRFLGRSSAASRLFDAEGGVAAAIQKNFDIRLPARDTLLVSQEGYARSNVIGLIDEYLKRPGYEAVALAGLEGTAGRGAVADVLAHYGFDANPEAPVFGAVVDGVTALDKSDLQEVNGRIDEALARIPGLIEEANRRQQSPFTFTGIVALLGLLLAALAYHGDEAERRKPGSEVIVAKLDELAQAAKVEVADRRDIRYVHDRAWLRAGPDRSAVPIRAVYPDQPMKVLEATDSWAKVEIFEYASERPLVGWISRARLRVGPAN